jgi:hypothetical protein
MRVVGVLLLALLTASCGGGIGGPSGGPSGSPAPHFVVIPPNYKAAVTKAYAANPDAYAAVIDEVGLRPNESVDYLVTAQASADYQCSFLNPNTPTGAQRTGPTQHVAGLVSATGTFLSDGTGEVNQILIVAAPAAPNQTCPAGCHLRPWRQTFLMVRVLDRGHQVHESLPGVSGEP